MQWLTSVYNQLAYVTCKGTLPGAAVILRDQAEDLYCTGYDYISQHLSKSDLVKDRQRNPNPNNSSNRGKTSIRLAGQCDGRGSSGCRGISGAVVDDPEHTHARAGVMRLGLEGCQPPINGLRVACLNRHQS